MMDRKWKRDCSRNLNSKSVRSLTRSFHTLLGGVQKFSCDNAGEVTDLESSHPKVSLGIVDLIDIGHSPFLAA